jgi:hypothetical protein
MARDLEGMLGQQNKGWAQARKKEAFGLSAGGKLQRFVLTQDSRSECYLGSLSRRRWWRCTTHLFTTSKRPFEGPTCARVIERMPSQMKVSIVAPFSNLLRAAP